MNFNKETLALHGAYNFDTQRSISVPIYQILRIILKI